MPIQLHLHQWDPWTINRGQDPVTGSWPGPQGDLNRWVTAQPPGMPAKPSPPA